MAWNFPGWKLRLEVLSIECQLCEHSLNITEHTELLLRTAQMLQDFGAKWFVPKWLDAASYSGAHSLAIVLGLLKPSIEQVRWSVGFVEFKQTDSESEAELV